MIVTQERIGRETATLERAAPRLWAYLQGRRERFESRKSSIYRGQPPFALFGVGPYSFAPYKVAVSGLHRPARFVALGPVGGRPVLLDDTCYLAPCATAAEAAVLAALANDPASLGLIAALCFPDAKRPVTKGLLQRIDLSAILGRSDRVALARRARAVLAEDLGIDDPDGASAIPDAVERIEASRIERDPHGLRADQPP